LGLSTVEQLSAAIPAFRYKCEAFIETNKKNKYARDKSGGKQTHKSSPGFSLQSGSQGTNQQVSA